MSIAGYLQDPSLWMGTYKSEGQDTTMID
ncbi:hypothetical protein EYZ11_004655 [Aspergillus tanneri]|uniref:Uncharacterized protein n=1 Tax=Aspergillus tanneri TaxID=1220188 RepID=A0A4S3JMB3_9EURO|nr:hypothetical protein EYZ11_004655 [Aspergillus tanneri]